MGAPKLLLPWRGKTIIEQTLLAWRAGGVEVTLVVVRPDDRELIKLVRACGAVAVLPQSPPPDMKSSARLALAHIEEHHAPQSEDCWLLAPADMPDLSPQIIRRLLNQYNQREILVPTLANRRGHPVLFPWKFAADVRQLGADEGVNAIVARRGSLEIACDDIQQGSSDPFADIDTPDDYRDLSALRPSPYTDSDGKFKV